MERKKLEAAAKMGLLSQEQIEPLLNFLNADIAEEEISHSEEQLRFVRSFGDIFITLGIVFVMVAAAKMNLSNHENIIPLVVSIATAEWLVRIRRLALPGIALLVAIIYFASQLVNFSFLDPALSNTAFLTFLAALFYFRYKMPFTLMPIAIGVISMVSMLTGITADKIQYISAIYGLAIFSVAMWFDSRDTARKNRLSDSAFWLHLLAAPLMVHGLMITLLTSADFVQYKAPFIMLFFFIFFLIALYIDRRAMLVSSLSYAIYAVIKIANDSGQGFENLTLMVFIVVGAFIIFFGANWYKVRNILFSRLANYRLSRYVPEFG